MSEPVTWDQVIAAAKKTGTTVDVQGRKNESLMVWVNALVASAGGQIIDPSSQGKPSDEAKIEINSKAGADAARIMSEAADSEVAPPAISTAGEEESRAAFQAENGGFMVNWPYVWAAFAAAEKSKTLPAGFSEDIGWARYPRVLPGTPSATPLGGASLAIGAFTEHPDLAVDAVRCIRSPENQVEHMIVAGDPGVSSTIFDDPEVQAAFPMWEQIRGGLDDAVPRPVSAYYGDVAGVIQQGYHPPGSLNPRTTPERTAELMTGVLDNTELLQEAVMSTVAPAAAATERGTEPPGRPKRAAMSERTRAERRLGLTLAGPAFFLMILVTGYPIISAIWLSLFDYRLTDPSSRSFVGLGNYGTILTDSLFWRQFAVTAAITVFTVAIEFVLGFALALVMHRALLLRKTLRTAILIPYGIVSVVSAYAWQYAFTPAYGFIDPLFNIDGFNWFGETAPALFVICLSEIWKTTPFLSLLLLAGLAQIPEDYLEAAKVDGASTWQRFYKVTMPNMKAAIMVALLFRTLDAFRIFDNVFIMTNGAQGTETLSFLAYRQTITRVQIGMGSAVSVILAVLVILIAVLFVKGFKTDLSQRR